MAQSRVQKGKSKKSKFPMWVLGIIVVLVVVIAGYAIVRFSNASDQYYSKALAAGTLKGGVNTIAKENATVRVAREVGNIPVYATFTSAEIGSMNKACAYVYASQNTQAVLQLQGGYYPGKALTSQPTVYFNAATGGWHHWCVNITKEYINEMKMVSYSSGTVTSTLKISESNPASATSYISVATMYLSNN